MHDRKLPSVIYRDSPREKKHIGQKSPRVPNYNTKDENLGKPPSQKEVLQRALSPLYYTPISELNNR